MVLRENVNLFLKYLVLCFFFLIYSSSNLVFKIGLDIIESVVIV